MQVAASSSCPENSKAPASKRMQWGETSNRSRSTSRLRRSSRAALRPWNRCSTPMCCSRLTAASGCLASNACSMAACQSPSAANHWQARKCQPRPAWISRVRTWRASGTKMRNQPGCSARDSMKQPSVCRFCSNDAPSPTPNRCSQSSALKRGRWARARQAAAWSALRRANSSCSR
ncbi:hypothetical protein FQZ97_727810 [compost metagenome]